MADRIDLLTPGPCEPPLDRDLLDAWVPPTPALDFADRVLAARSPRRRRFRAPPFVAAAAAIVLGVGLGLGLDSSLTSAPTQALDSAAPSLAAPDTAPRGPDTRWTAGADDLGSAQRLKRRGTTRRSDVEELQLDRSNGQVSFEADAEEQGAADEAARATPGSERSGTEGGREAAVEAAY